MKAGMGKVPVPLVTLVNILWDNGLRVTSKN